MAAEEVRPGDPFSTAATAAPPAEPSTPNPGPRPEERPFQFGTRSLLAVMALACLVLALGRIFGAAWAMTVVWFGILVAAHIAANFWGKRNFRQQQAAAAEMAVDEGTAGPQASGADRETVRALQARTAERIARIRLGWTTVGVTVLGVLLGGGVGTAIGFVCFDLQQANAVNGIIVAAVSAAVLGGFLGFWCASFVHVFYAYNVAGWEGALADRPPNKPR